MKPADLIDHGRRSLLWRAAAVMGTTPWFAACGGGVASGAAEAAGIPPATPTPTPTPTPPPSALPPPPLGSGYRSTATYLFQPVPIAKASTLGGSAYSYERWGPTDKYIDFLSGWTWDHVGGDYLDAALVRQGSSPWATANLNAVSGGTAVFEYTGINVTQVVQYAQTADRWLAILLKMAAGGAPRVIAGPLTPGGHPPPRIDVTYSDATTGVLACRIVARTTGGSSVPQTTDGPGMNLPAFLEFERPNKPVASASLRFTVIAHWSGGVTTCELYLIDPPMNTEPVTGTTGLGPQAGLLDAGITSLPGVIGAHRYLDGAALADFVASTPYVESSASSYDPAIYTGGAADFSKLPHADLGKFVGSNDAGLWSLVPSAYAADGFAPLAAGLGALRVEMPDAGVVTGQEQRNGGTVAASRKIMMPEAEFGRLSHIFVRYYVRFGTPYNPVPGDRKEVLRFGNSSWTDMAGKWGITPEHTTTYGGVSGSAGGGKGWTLRHRWADCDAAMGGPNEGGITSGWHLFDYQGNNPVGHRYVSDPLQFEGWGRLGGLGGTIYAGRWYCIEQEVKLNSVDRPSGTGDGKFWTPDGELRVWVDGRKVFDRTGMVFRTLPLEGPAFDPGQLNSVRELGVKGLWFNWYHGGLNNSTRKRVMFVTGLAWAKSRIGPMKMGADV